MIAAIVKFLTGGFVDRIFGIAETYIKTEGDKAKFRAEVQQAAQQAAADVEKEWAKAAASITASVQDTFKASQILQRALAIVLLLQLFVLVWYQVGTSCYQIITGTPWPLPIAEIEWAYLLIGSMVAPALILKMRR